MAAGTLEAVVTALYRRYRPENFAELIGQTQVTDPLRTALRTNRVNHAYLFSGPRGCGKTTSARILARCLNCAEGPTDTPCGVCPSCVELSRDGGGSLDVVEIDAASHNGVDDARDLRERAIFAPARDRYKIFILDEAHMVTPQGFNALLKIVEEPPEHVKFIFATTEPEKVIGTIRSRTHHYPFRLVPPAQMLEYVQQLCESEGVAVEPGVLPLVVRAGGGSVRDTLSLLDQLMAGSDDASVQYERAVALLGYTHGALLAEVIDSLGARDAPAAFAGVDRVIQTGQDPRRFVDDLLERLRDLIIVGAMSMAGSPDAAAAVLRGVQPDELDHMARQAAAFGVAELSRAADVVNTALTEMTGATSPRLHLELMIARVLVPASDDTERGALARLERIERRIGVEPQHEHQPSRREVAGPPTVIEPAPSPDRPAEPIQPSSVAQVHQAPAEQTTPPSRATEPPATPSAHVGSDAPTPTAVAPRADAAVSLQQLKDAWPEILDAVQKSKRSAWMVVYTAQVLALDGDVLRLSFISENDVTSFKEQQGADGVSEHLRSAIVDVLGLRVKFIATVDAATQAPAEHRPAAPAARSTTWATVQVPSSDPGSPGTTDGSSVQSARRSADATAPASRAPVSTAPVPPVAVTTAPVSTAPVSTAPVSTAPLSASSASAPPSSMGSVADLAEPIAEADREPEPEFEPDDSPIAGPTPPARTAAATAPTAGSTVTTAPSAEAPDRAKTQTTAKTPATASTPTRTRDQDKRRYGEAVVREILQASFIEEQPVTPRVTPRGD